MNTSLLWSKRKKEFCSGKLQEFGLQRAYSREALSRTNHLDEVEPISPNASTYSVMSIKNTEMISDEDLARNILLFKKGELSDELCQSCGLSLILHAFPRKHYCDIIKIKKNENENDEEWMSVKLGLVQRMNSMMLKSSFEAEKVDKDIITEKIVTNLEKLAEKINQISTSNPTAVSTGRTQVVARRSCPSWTAGTSIEVYRRWVDDWNSSDNSDNLIKHMDITKNLSENKKRYIWTKKLHEKYSNPWIVCHRRRECRSCFK